MTWMPFFYVSTIIFWVIQTWSQVALVYAIKDSNEKIGIKESYRRGWSKFGSFILVSILSVILIGSGFLLLIIPGFIFAIWFSLATFIVIEENIGGMDALLKSREYVKGRWWEIFSLFFGIGIATVAISIVLGIIIIILGGIVAIIANNLNILFIKEFFDYIQNHNVKINFDFSFLLTPLITSYCYLIYQYLKRIKGDFVFTPSPRAKISFIVIGILGILIWIGIGILMSSFFSSIKSGLIFSDGVNQTKLLWESGKYQESLDKSQLILKEASTDKDKAIAHYWIGLSRYKLQDYNNAESQLKLALELYPDYAAPYVTLAAIEIDTRSNFSKALEYANKCVELDPKYAWCYNSKGLALVQLGQKDEGIKALEQAILLAPDSYVFCDNLTRVK